MNDDDTKASQPDIEDDNAAEAAHQMGYGASQPEGAEALSDLRYIINHYLTGDIRSAALRAYESREQEIDAALARASQAPAVAPHTGGAEPVVLRVGGRYNWKNQPERLVYMGLNRSGNGYWHQFEKVDAPGVVWCEVPRNDDLLSFEETPPAAEPAGGALDEIHAMGDAARGESEARTRAALSDGGEELRTLCGEAVAGNWGIVKLVAAIDATLASRAAPAMPERVPDEFFCLETMNADNWRGYDYGCESAANALQRVLDGKDDGTGVGNEPWESQRRRVLALMATPAAEPAGRALSDDSQDLTAAYMLGKFDGRKEAEARARQDGGEELRAAAQRLADQVRFLVSVTTPMTSQQKEVWPELTKRLDLLQTALSRTPQAAPASEEGAPLTEVIRQRGRLMTATWEVNPANVAPVPEVARGMLISSGPFAGRVVPPQAPQAAQPEPAAHLSGEPVRVKGYSCMQCGCVDIVPDASQPDQQPEPAGWKLVPIEPTEAMLAAIPFPTSVTPRLGVECWQAMLAAAPQSEADRAALANPQGTKS